MQNRRAFLLHCNNKDDSFRRINLLTHLGPAASKYTGKITRSHTVHHGQ